MFLEYTFESTYSDIYWFSFSFLCLCLYWEDTLTDLPFSYNFGCKKVKPFLIGFVSWGRMVCQALIESTFWYVGHTLDTLPLAIPESKQRHGETEHLLISSTHLIFIACCWSQDLSFSDLSNFLKWMFFSNLNSCRTTLCYFASHPKTQTSISWN